MSEAGSAGFSPPKVDTPKPAPESADRAGTPRPDREQSRAVAEKVIDNKINEVRKKYTSGGQIDTDRMSPQEFDLYSIHVLRRRGFLPKEFAKYPDGIPFAGEGIQVTTTGADGEPVTTNVKTIKEQKVDANNNVVEYVCTTDDPNKNVTVSAADLTKGFMEKMSSSIAKNFDGDQQPIVSWYTQGEKGNPPIEAVAKEMDPINQADRLIQKRLAELRQGHDKLDKKALEAIKKEIVLLEQALKIQGGSEFGAVFKMNALQTIALNKMGTPDAAQLAEVMNGLEPQADKAQKNLDKALIDAGIDQKDVNRIRTEGVDVLLNDRNLLKKFMAIPNFEQRLYGNNLPRDEEIDALADQLLTPAQKAALEEEGGDKRRSWLKVILLLLASPVLIAGGIGVAAMPMMSGAISGER